MKKKTFDKFFDDLDGIMNGETVEKESPYEEIVERIYTLAMKLNRKVATSVNSGRESTQVFVHSSVFGGDGGCMSFYFYAWQSDTELSITFNSFLEAVHEAVEYTVGKEANHE